MRISDWSSDVCSSDLRTLVHLGCGRTRIEPDIHAGRFCDSGSHDPFLHGVGVLGVPRQSRCGGLSLNSSTPAPLWKRLLWFAAIWAASVLILSLVGGLIRLVLKDRKSTRLNSSH